MSSTIIVNLIHGRRTRACAIFEVRCANFLTLYSILYIYSCPIVGNVTAKCQYHCFKALNRLSAKPFCNQNFLSNVWINAKLIGTRLSIWHFTLFNLQTTKFHKLHICWYPHIKDLVKQISCFLLDLIVRAAIGYNENVPGGKASAGNGRNY